MFLRTLIQKSNYNQLSLLPKDVARYNSFFKRNKSSLSIGERANQYRKEQNVKNAIKSPSLSTILAHAGITKNSNNENMPLSPPIELATTYQRPLNGTYGPNDYIYSRSNNPNRELLESTMVKLEG